MCLLMKEVSHRKRHVLEETLQFIDGLVTVASFGDAYFEIYPITECHNARQSHPSCLKTEQSFKLQK